MYDVRPPTGPNPEVFMVESVISPTFPEDNIQACEDCPSLKDALLAPKSMILLS
jgi:hypothetical protein